MGDEAEAVRDIKNKLFGPTRRDVPWTYLQLLKARGATDWKQFVDASNRAVFCVYWLDGGMFRSFAYRGADDNASADECMFPLSKLTGITTSYTFLGGRINFDYEHSHWGRTVEIRFQGAEPIVLRDDHAPAGEPTQISAFVDAVAEAAALSPPEP